MFEVPSSFRRPAKAPRHAQICVQLLPPCAGRLHLTEAPMSPLPIGERPFDKRTGGPAPKAWEGEGGAQLSRCFLKQTRRRKLPLTFPSLTRWVPSSPRGERKKGTSLPNAIALPPCGGGAMCACRSVKAGTTEMEILCESIML